MKSQMFIMLGNWGFHMMTSSAFPFGFPSKQTHAINVWSKQTPDHVTEHRLVNQKIYC